MGRYTINQPHEDTFRPQGSEGVDFYVRKQLQDQDKKSKLKQLIQTALTKNMQLKPGGNPNQVVKDSGDVDFSQLQNIPAKTSSSMYDVMNADKIIGRKPEDWLASGMAQQPILGTRVKKGNPGNWIGMGKTPDTTENIIGDIQLNPDAQAILARARDAIRSPASSGGSVLGRQMPNVQAGGDQSGSLPDAAEYEDGTVLEDDNGQQYKVMNGQWTAQ